MSLKPLPESKVKLMIQKFLTTSGATTPALRQAVMARAAALVDDGQENAEPVPKHWQTYVNKVALYAYRVTNEDVTHLKENGYSEDEIFEVTIAAAMGAARSRLERGLALLYGGE
ncbi:hypothetical protein KFU94_44250 [Chloroflexi bacterium TSY]|nr:hypothetical protein [Chloroflexi bacterium TSY]